MKRYAVARAKGDVPVAADWDAPAWEGVAPLRIDQFHVKSSDHRPDARARVLHDGASVHVIFRVEDRYVRAVSPGYNAGVCTDSCVEFFARPRPARGYFNFEVNCGGTLLCSFIEDWTRTPEGFAKFVRIPPELGATVTIAASLPARVEPEIETPVTWCVAMRVPVALLERYLGPLGPLPGQRWRANFYKCADDTSHPHWAAWSAVDPLNFHQPDLFGEIEFG